MKQNDCFLWTAEYKAPVQYPWLDKPEDCDVLVVGGGCTGAMIAYRLAKAGINTVIVSADKIGFGQTSQAPAFVTYELSKSMEKLSECIGAEKALEAYQMSSRAMESLDALIHELGQDVGYVQRDSLYYSDSEKGAEDLKAEYLLRKHNGFPVEFVSGNSGVDDFSFPIQAGIYTTGLSASVNPYLLTHALLQRAQEAGARIYENTGVDCIEKRQEKQTAVTDTRQCITANRVVIATGRGADGYLEGCTVSRTLFTLASDPLPQIPAGWKNACLIKNDSDLTACTALTADNRIVVSKIESGLLTGEGKIAGCVPVQSLENRKYINLEKELVRMFPAMQGMTPRYRYVSPLELTCDGLPLAGTHEEYEGYYFARCVGGNLLFSEIAGRFITELHQGKTPAHKDLLAPDRFSEE